MDDDCVHGEVGIELIYSSIQVNPIRWIVYFVISSEYEGLFYNNLLATLRFLTQQAIFE